MYVKHFGADVPETVFSSRGNNKRLASGQCDVLFVDPHLGFAGDYGKHFLYRVRMCRRSNCRHDPLLKYAKLSCTIAGGDMHTGFHARSPFFSGLIFMCNCPHCASPSIPLYLSWKFRTTILPIADSH